MSITRFTTPLVSSSHGSIAVSVDVMESTIGVVRAVLQSEDAMLPMATQRSPKATATPSSPMQPSGAVGGAASSRRLPPITNALFLIPGNPGVVEFYRGFVEELRSRHPTFYVAVVGFAGHSLSSAALGHRTDQDYDLQDQIQVQEKFFEQVVARLHALRRGRVNIYYAGHSIGAYIALHLACRHGVLLRKCFLLAPTICNMAQSPNGVAKHRLLFTPGLTSILSWVSGVVASLPGPIRDLLLSLCQPQLDRNARLVAGSMGMSLVRNMMHLARSEFVQVRSLDAAMLRECLVTAGMTSSGSSKGDLSEPAALTKTGSRVSSVTRRNSSVSGTNDWSTGARGGNLSGRRASRAGQNSGSSHTKGGESPVRAPPATTKRMELVFYFVKRDEWVPETDVREIRRTVEALQGEGVDAAASRVTIITEDDEAVPHAWCLNHNEEVVDHAIVPYVVDIWDDHEL